MKRTCGVIAALLVLASLSVMSCKKTVDDPYTDVVLTTFYDATRQVLPAYNASGSVGRFASTGDWGSAHPVYKLVATYMQEGDTGNIFNIYNTVKSLDKELSYIASKGSDFEIAPKVVKPRIDLGFNGDTDKCTYDHENLMFGGLWTRTDGTKNSVLRCYKSDDNHKSVLQAYFDSETGELEMGIIDYGRKPGEETASNRYWVEGNLKTHTFSIKMIGHMNHIHEGVEHDELQKMVGYGVSQGAGKYMLFNTGRKINLPVVDPLSDFNRSMPYTYILEAEPCLAYNIPAVATVADLKDLNSCLFDPADARLYEADGTTDKLHERGVNFLNPLSDLLNYKALLPVAFETLDLPIDAVIQNANFTIPIFE